MRSGTGTGTTGLAWILGDHLGSTSITVDAATGAKLSEIRYKPWGEVRYSEGETGTKYKFTGQQEEMGGLYFYGARFYDSSLNRFLSPDSVVPDNYNPLDWDRYSYTRNNPLKYTDPTGHFPDILLDLTFIALDIYFIQSEGWTPTNTVALCADVALAIVPVGTGAGPAIQTASRGPKAAAVAYAHAAAQIPAVARLGQTAGKWMQFASQAGDDPSFQGNPKSDNGLDPSKIFIPTDKSKQVTKRGWSLDSIKNVMANPAMTRSTADNASIFNRANGNPVTYYYRPDGHYVVIDNQTGQVVQISDTFDPGWIDEMTDKPIHPMQ